MSMIEYTDKDSKEIRDALSTLVLKCVKAGGYEFECTITYGDNLKLDCHFDFKVHKEDEP